MSALGKILEGARVLRLRQRLSMREALAMSLARERRRRQGMDTTTLPVLPSASRLDALLPRNREPTMEEIREAWQESLSEAPAEREIA